MENTINERLRVLINRLNCNINTFSSQIGIPQTSLSTALIRSKTLSSQLLENIIIAFPDVNISWLLTGKGEMLQSYSNQSIAKTKPRIPMTAAAGRLTESLEGVTLVQCEQVPVIESFPSYDFTILIKGDSMQPRYFSGDEVACKRIDEKSFIQWGRVHILDTAQGVVIKRIYEDGNGIRCNSFNPEYGDFTIPKSDIYSISLVVGLLRL